jgi:hypothetical protein
MRSVSLRPARLRVPALRSRFMWVLPLRIAPLRFAPLRFARLRFGPPEVRPVEVRLEEVRIDVGVLVTPLVPGGYTLLEQCDVLVVRHGSTLCVGQPHSSSAPASPAVPPGAALRPS